MSIAEVKAYRKGAYLSILQHNLAHGYTSIQPVYDNHAGSWEPCICSYNNSCRCVYSVNSAEQVMKDLQISHHTEEISPTLPFHVTAFTPTQVQANDAHIAKAHAPTLPRGICHKIGISTMNANERLATDARVFVTDILLIVGKPSEQWCSTRFQTGRWRGRRGTFTD